MEAVRPTRNPADLVTCPKCAGKRTVGFCSVYTGQETSRGRCFDCDGKGQVTRAKRDSLKSAAERAGLASYTLNIVLLALRDGDQDRADFYLPQAIPNLQLAGTAHARDVLRQVATGAWYDDHQGTRGTVGPVVGRQVRDELVRLGREALQPKAA